MSVTTPVAGPHGVDMTGFGREGFMKDANRLITSADGGVQGSSRRASAVATLMLGGLLQAIFECQTASVSGCPLKDHDARFTTD